MIPHFSIQPSLSLTLPRFSLSCPSIIFFLSYFSFLLNSVCVCACVCMRAADPGGLRDQFTLAPGSQSYRVCVKMSAVQAGPLLFSSRQGWGSRINWAE